MLHHRGCIQTGISQPLRIDNFVLCAAVLPKTIQRTTPWRAYQNCSRCRTVRLAPLDLKFLEGRLRVSMARRILIADDSDLMRRQLRMILDLDSDVEICTEATNGVEAVQKVQECCPDLAVMDFQMPEMNGLEATRMIKRMMPAMPVLIFALENSAQLQNDSKDAGAEGVLAKEEGGARLSQVIHSLLHLN